jgi:hypothetical protein
MFLALILASAAALSDEELRTLVKAQSAQIAALQEKVEALEQQSASHASTRSGQQGRSLTAASEGVYLELRSDPSRIILGASDPAYVETSGTDLRIQSPSNGSVLVESSSLAITGNVSAPALTATAVAVTGDISVQGHLSATGDVTMSANVTVGGDVTAAGALRGDGSQLQGVQVLIHGSCAAGEALAGINADGSVTCSPLPEPPPVASTPEWYMARPGPNNEWIEEFNTKRFDMRKAFCSGSCCGSSCVACNWCDSRIDTCTHGCSNPPCDQGSSNVKSDQDAFMCTLDSRYKAVQYSAYSSKCTARATYRGRRALTYANGTVIMELSKYTHQLAGRYNKPGNGCNYPHNNGWHSTITMPIRAPINPRYYCGYTTYEVYDGTGELKVSGSPESPTIQCPPINNDGTSSSWLEWFNVTDQLVWNRLEGW